MTTLKPARHFDTQPIPAQPTELKAASHFAGEHFISVQVETAVTPVKSSRWWWRLATAMLLTIVVLSVWQWVAVLVQSWQQNVLQATLLTLISLAALVLLGTLIWREVMLWRRLARNQQWQQSAQRIGHSVQYGEAGRLCQAVAASLPASPTLTAALEQWRGAVKDEHSDNEQLQLFQRLVLVELDKQAQQLVYRAATDTSMAVAISPFALADMLLVLWRSSRLVRELAQVYGGSIGQLRSLVLLKQLFTALLWAGGSELALDMASDVIGSELTAKLSARAGQGLIAGLLVARLGNLAQQHLRPLPADATASVSIGKLTKALLQRFNAAVQTKADSARQP